MHNLKRTDSRNGAALISSLILTFAAITLMDGVALANETTLRAATDAFAGPAVAVYDLLDSGIGTLASLTALGLTIAALVKGWNTPVAAGGLGVAVAALNGPDIILNLRGTAVIF